MSKINWLLLIAGMLVADGCATSRHGSFAASTYVDPESTHTEVVGKVHGESRQTWVLYLFPIGKAPSTDDAIADAKSRIEGTRFLTDLSVDDRTYWGFGYLEAVIEVSATAHK